MQTGSDEWVGVDDISVVVGRTPSRHRHRRPTRRPRRLRSQPLADPDSHPIADPDAHSHAHADSPTPTPIPPTTHVNISQIYGGGGNSGATLKNDFIELYNPTDAIGLAHGLVGPVHVLGWDDLAADAADRFHRPRQVLPDPGGRRRWRYTVDRPDTGRDGWPSRCPRRAGKVALVSSRPRWSGACPTGRAHRSTSSGTAQQRRARKCCRPRRSRTRRPR